MWPLQPTLNVTDRCQSIAKAALASGGILVCAPSGARVFMW